MTAVVIPIVVEGLVLGWSVAWPPGPINAEMMRRALTSGFRSAVAVSLGACAGDFLWALVVGLGAGAINRTPLIATALAAVSLALLLFLGTSFLRGAVKAWKTRSAPASVPASTFSRTRGGFILGLTMALSSPWNIGFWLAIIGQQASRSWTASLVLALAVVGGAVLWGLVFTAALALGARWMSPSWAIFTQGATAILMFAFAVRLIWRMAGA